MPTSAGVTVPYRRTSPTWEDVRTCRVILGATCAVTVGLVSGREPLVRTRSCVLFVSPLTGIAKAPAAFVVRDDPTSTNAVRYGYGLDCSEIACNAPPMPVSVPWST